MIQGIYTIKENIQLTSTIYKMTLVGNTESITHSGQFINIKIDNLYLRRPISICDYNENEIIIIYKVVGEGTKVLSQKQPNEKLDCLVGLGNGYDLSIDHGPKALLIGGGVGVPPLYNLAKKLKELNKEVTVVLGFNNKEEIFYYNEFKEIVDHVYVCTMDGSFGDKGNVVELILNRNIDCDSYYTCGPERMLEGIHKNILKPGYLSFEARMGCGFGACMGCSCKTLTGNKRICVEGPILKSSEVIFGER